MFSLVTVSLATYSPGAWHRVAGHVAEDRSFLVTVWVSCEARGLAVLSALKELYLRSRVA